VPSTAAPIAAPMMSWAMVPTMISESAVDTRSQIDKRDAIRASPSHNAAKAQMLVMVLPCLHGSCPQGLGQAVLGLTKNPPGGGFADLASHRMRMMR
jgi:hypothetical protein